MKESDVRKFSKTLAVVSILAPASAFPLGVGDIQMHSALNQKLNADIALILAGNENIADVKVNLAPPEKFDEAGIPWNFFLSRIDFKVVKQANGATVIHMSSREALNEPFLDFLLEVTWPKGNIYREFTVLVDPPATYQYTVIPVATASAVAKSTTKNRLTSRPELTRTALSDKKQSIQSVYRKGEYGPTNRYDTLWSVARKVKPSAEITDKQMMMALYEANPKAFYKANVNALSAGYTLRVPGKDVILRMSRQQAITEFAQHNEAWKAGTAIASATNKPDVKKGKGTAVNDSNQLKLVAPTEDEISDNAIATAGGAETIGTGSGVDVKEFAELDAVNQELEAKMDGLEQQLIKMQKMIELKNAELAALQGQKETSPSQSTVPDSLTETKADINKQLIPPASTPGVEVKPQLKTKVTPPLEKVNTKPVEQQIPDSDSDSGINSYYLTFGGVGIGVLALLGFIWWKKRNEEVRYDTDSMFAGSSEITLPEVEEGLSIPGIEASSTYDVGTVGESSILSEFTPSDFESFEMDQSEVDPISEADVYLAYGRYKQAEELMLQAIEDQPGRDECKLKLLEIYYANENKDAFEKYANELAESGKRKDSAFWGKVIEMGGEVNPDSQLFKETDETQDVADFKNVVESEADLDNDDLTATETIDEADKSEAVETDDLNSLTPDTPEDGLSFDLNLDSDINSKNEEPASFPIEEKKIATESEQQIESIDFNLTTDDRLNEELRSETEELDSFDFTSESTAQDGSLEQNEADDIGLALDVDEDQQAEDLTEMDELETKIDLAKAYIDMGDDDAAKNIAQEVLDKGNEVQKQSAEAVLSKLK
jgi:pilus assembly protein FimV